MRARESLGTVAEVLLLILVLGPLLGHLLGQPILFGYVETESMSPTLRPGDGFVAVPKPLAGDVEEGDVVVFRARKIHHGGLVTHRVVGRTRDGAYITKGDNNPVADQQAEEPPVEASRVVATALQVGGHVVVIPNLGDGVVVVQQGARRGSIWLHETLGIDASVGPGTLFFLVSILLGFVYLTDAVREGGESRSRERRRSRGTDTRFLVALIASLLVISATAAMVVPSGPTHFRASFREPKTGNYTVKNGGVAPVVVFLESDPENVTVDPRTLSVGGLQSKSARVAVAPDPYRRQRTLVERRYLAVLPPETIRRLHDVHPWVPVVVIDALLGVPFYLVGIWLVGTGRYRSRRRDAPSRVRRLWNRLA